MAYKNPPAAREQVILLKMLNRELQVSKKEVTFIIHIVISNATLTIDTDVSLRFFLVVVDFINGSGQNC